MQSAGLLRFRHRFVPWLHRRYGDVFTVRILPSPRAIVVFTGPDAIRDVFAGDPDVFHAGEAAGEPPVQRVMTVGSGANPLKPTVE